MPDPAYNVYVIRLDPAVSSIKKFLERNEGYVDGKPCVYVGMTSCSVDERFEQHLAGYKANRYAKKFGRYLMRKRCMLGLSRSAAEREEVQVAETLRAKGWGVWQN